MRPHLKRWTGVYAGWVLSSEIGNPGSRRCRTKPEGQERRCAPTRARRGPAESKTPRMHRNSTRENREAPIAPAQSAGRSEKPMRYKSETNVAGESSGCIVLTKCPNKARRLAAEGIEGRRLAKEIRRQGPELDTVPAEPGALSCQRNALIVSGQRRPYPRWEPCALGARARVCAGGAE